MFAKKVLEWVNDPENQLDVDFAHQRLQQKLAASRAAGQKTDTTEVASTSEMTTAALVSKAILAPDMPPSPTTLSAGRGWRVSAPEASTKPGLSSTVPGSASETTTANSTLISEAGVSIAVVVEDAPTETEDSDHGLWMSAGQKHARDYGSDEDELPRTPKTTVHSPAMVPTERPDSPLEVSSKPLHDPFQDDGGNGQNEYDEEGPSVFLPVSDQTVAFPFEGRFDGVDLGEKLRLYFAAVRRKTVYIEDVEEALARSGIIFINDEVTKLQKELFGTGTLEMVQESFKRQFWVSVDSAARRDQVRSWIDSITDAKYDRAKAFSEICNAPPSDPIDEKLWMYLLHAIREFPKSQELARSYSESTGISSFILQICRVYMGCAEKSTFLNFVDTCTVSGKQRPEKSRKKPDMALELKNRLFKTVLELAIGEVTSYLQRNFKKKNAQDLFRVGTSLKDALDLVHTEYGVKNAVFVGFQVIGETLSIYLMTKCGNLFLMMKTMDLKVPDSLEGLEILSAQCIGWYELRATIDRGIEPVLNAYNNGPVVDNGPPLPFFQTVCTPEIKEFLKKSRKLCKSGNGNETNGDGKGNSNNGTNSKSKSKRS
ncbi:hypothetical protein EDD11_000005 [Mortierella claussenii]|nr:hypothetical protein EDD11_000005 [Mortierella claussenii]